MMRNLFSILIFAAIQISFAATLHASRAELIYDGNLIQKAEITEIHGVEYLPLKAVAAMFKGRMQWYPIAGKVVLQLRNQKITFNIDSRTALIGSQKWSMSGSARLVRGSVLVPADFFLTETFGEITDCRVRWDASSLILTADPKVSLLSPRIYTRSKFTRVVLESTEETSPEIKKKNNIVTIDLPKLRIASEDSIKVKDKVVEAVSLASAHRGVTVKVTLARGVTSYSWIEEKNPYRLVLKFENPNPYKALEDEPLSEIPDDVSASTETIASTTVAEGVEPPNLPDANAPLHISKNRIKKIVVDAGHGGKDTGAIGRMGTKEKDINLLIALELARVLRIDGGYEVYLTRTDDTFVSLIDRTVFANEKKADLFISIHCNASISKSQGGFEIYFLAENASDPHAEAAEEFENSVEEMEEHSAKKQKVQELLFSMAKNEFMNESSLLCNAIDTAVVKRVPIDNRGVKRANFHVLHGTEMPSVLIETAFVTRPSEEQKLRQRKYRSAIVDAVLTGVESYIRQLEQLQQGY